MDRRPLDYPFSYVRIKNGGLALYKSMFGSIPNTLLTLVILYFLFQVARPLADWLVFNSVVLPADARQCLDANGACWAFVQLKFRTIIFGRYPTSEQWRPLLSMSLLIIGLVLTADWRQWSKKYWKKFMCILWICILIADGTLMTGGLLSLDYISPDRWSGLPLTLIMAVFGILLAFIVGIFVALGRVSRLPVIRWFCLIYTELVRGVPLITLLFMTVIMLPILLPEKLEIHKVLEAQLAFVIFFSAYMAEVFRGGLQSLPRGQFEASLALGMGYYNTVRKIIFPQVFRLTIPSTVNTLINAFKDTSLVVIISMLDLLGTTQAVIKDPAWFGIFMEAYIFTAFIYFIFCATLSWYSQRLERHFRLSRR
ncbi:MAG: amino acid ABC transporter permease [Porticoccaceae bacterium]|nr:amino acid ABC transporter permease [Porticoccaceae bacterium]